MRNLMAHPTKLDMGCTLTNKRTDVQTDDFQDKDDQPQVPNSSKGVDEVDSLRVWYATEDVLGLVGAVHERLPVRNREPRPMPEANRRLWGAMMRRDGSRCWMCGMGGFLVIDHLRPRSNFDPDDMWLADRSDNLRIACWDCNQDKSNRAVPYRPPIPIVWTCPECYRPEDDVEGLEPLTFLEYYSDEMRPAHCVRHGYAMPVPVDWEIASLVHGND